MTPIGSQVKVTLLRSGKTLDIMVRIGDLKDEEKLLFVSMKERLGGDFRDVTQKEAAALGLESPLGVVVTSVEPKGPLAQAGLEAGDLILEIEGTKVSDTNSLAEIIGTLPAQRQVSVLVADLKKKSAATVKVTVR
jgi:serine protease Do